jgi:hypothetical protein
VGIGQRRRRRIRLERITVRRLARHAHRNAVGERALGIACAQATPGKFGDMVGHQRKAGAGAGREIGGTARPVLAGNAFEPPQQVSHEIRGLLQALAADPQAGMHVHAQGRLPAAQRAGLVEVNRLVG